MTTNTTIPIPVPTLDNQEFWDGVNRHELLVQRCTTCGTPRHYPRPACFHCGSMEYEYVPSTGRGTVYSFVISHQAFHPFFDDQVPYNVSLIELDDLPGVRLCSTVVGVENDALQIGLPVQVFFDEIADGVSLYRFRPLIVS